MSLGACRAARWLNGTSGSALTTSAFAFALAGAATRGTKPARAATAATTATSRVFLVSKCHDLVVIVGIGFGQQFNHAFNDKMRLT